MDLMEDLDEFSDLWEDCMKNVEKTNNIDTVMFPSSESHLFEKESNDQLQYVKDHCKTVQHLNQELTKLRKENELVQESIIENENKMNSETNECKAIIEKRENMIIKRETKRKKIDEMNRKVHQKLQEITGIINNNNSDPFLDNLGLQVSSVTKETETVSCLIYFHGFRNVNNQPCSCEISIDTSVYPHGEYKIIRSCPEISCTKIKSLEKYINMTGDLCGLFVTVRKEFLILCKNENLNMDVDLP